jgi:hypothetical protein
MLEEGQRDTSMPKASERKLRAFIKKWSQSASAVETE